MIRVPQLNAVPPQTQGGAVGHRKPERNRADGPQVKMVKWLWARAEGNSTNQDLPLIGGEAKFKPNK